jgi:cyclopropane fatty-acyl-phospholipid synthase-like methyltransferase
MTDLNTFYSMVSVDVWEQILGEDKLFYHGDYRHTYDFAEAQRQVIYNFLEFIPPTAHILDVGCGWGASLPIMRDKGFTAEGLTISTRQATYCQKNSLPAQYADMNTHRLSEHYDTILSIEVMDHFSNRADLFKHFREHSKQLAISINCVADDFIGNRLAYGDTMPMPTTSELRKDVEEAGWRITQWNNRRQESLPTLFHWHKQLEEVFGEQPPQGVFASLYDMTQQFFKNPSAWAQSFPLIDVIAG